MIIGRLILAVVLVLGFASPLLAVDSTIDYIDDFSAWTFEVVGEPNLIVKGVMPDNGADLRWNATANILAVVPRDRLLSYTVTPTLTGSDVIKRIEFDWRYGGELDVDWLVFSLRDQHGNILWQAPITGQGIEKVLHTDFSITEFEATSLTFDYRLQSGEFMAGKPPFFVPSNRDDYDALVDNVTLTIGDSQICPEPGPTTIEFTDDFSAWTITPTNTSVDPSTSSSGIGGSQFYPLEPGDNTCCPDGTLRPDNDTDLRMDLAVNSGGLSTAITPTDHPCPNCHIWEEEGRWVSYRYAPTLAPGEYIAGIDFDSRFDNDATGAGRLVVELWNGVNSPTPGNPGGPGVDQLFNVPESASLVSRSLSFTQAQNVTSLHFVYRQIGPDWGFPPAGGDPLIGKPGLFSQDTGDYDMQIDNVTVTISDEDTAPGPSGEILFVSDFTAWANINGILTGDIDSAFPEPNMIPGHTNFFPVIDDGIPNNGSDYALDTSNTDQLRWNLIGNLEPNDTENSFVISAPGPITSVQFDWKFGGEDNAALLFQLMDDADNVLWTAPATTAGAIKTWTCGQFFGGLNTRTVRFVYTQLNQPLLGKAAIFDPSATGDWDAAVDNVVLTFDFDVPPDHRTVHYYNDFDEWLFLNGANHAGWEMGGWFPLSKDTGALTWDLTLTHCQPPEDAGQDRDRWRSWTIGSPTNITQIEFDWRFSKDDSLDSPIFRLYSGEGSASEAAQNTVLWSAHSTPGGIPNPWHLNQTVQIPPDTKRLTFQYLQREEPFGGCHNGQPGLFFDPAAEDFDAIIDNVTLTVAGTCDVPGDLDGNCLVNLADLILMGGDAWLTTLVP